MVTQTDDTDTAKLDLEVGGVVYSPDIETWTKCVSGDVDRFGTIRHTLYKTPNGVWVHLSYEDSDVVELDDGQRVQAYTVEQVGSTIEDEILENDYPIPPLEEQHAGGGSLDTAQSSIPLRRIHYARKVVVGDTVSVQVSARPERETPHEPLPDATYFEFEATVTTVNEVGYKVKLTLDTGDELTFAARGTRILQRDSEYYNTNDRDHPKNRVDIAVINDPAIATDGVQT